MNVVKLRSIFTDKNNACAIEAHFVNLTGGSVIESQFPCRDLMPIIWADIEKLPD
jgi:hypothetical protein